MEFRMHGPEQLRSEPTFRRAFVWVALLFAVLRPAFADDPRVAASASAAIEDRRLTALRADLSSGAKEAEARFWSGIKSAGTPLLEAIEGRPDEVRVTFLWKGTAETKSVRLLSGPQMMNRYTELGFVRLEGTDVWFRTLNVPVAWRVAYVLAENAEARGYPKGGAWMAAAVGDPLNPRRSEPDPSAPMPAEKLFTIFETPGVPPETLLHRQSGVAAGVVTTRQVPSARLGSDRAVDVYVPAGTGNKTVGTLYLFDGESYLRDMRIADVLDNLIAQRRMAPVVAVLIRSTPAARGRELSSDPAFTEFLATELVPWVRKNYPVSEDPRRTIVGGMSLGGLEACYSASSHPEIFGAVLSQSGSFWWRPPASEPTNASEPWMATRYSSAGSKQIRLFLSVGRYEPEKGGLINNQRMSQALRGNGYELKYEEVEGQHDWVNWRMTLPGGLIYLAPLE